MNCQSLQDKLCHIQNDHVLMQSDIMCFTETWLKDDFPHPSLQIEGFRLSLNSYGHQRGKGVAVYIRSAEFSVLKDIKLPNLQVSYISSKMMDVILVYRSASCNSNVALQNISSLLHPEKTTIIC